MFMCVLSQKDVLLEMFRCVRHVNCWLWCRGPVSCHGRTIATFPLAHRCNNAHRCNSNFLLPRCTAAQHILLLKFLWQCTLKLVQHNRVHCFAWPGSNYIAVHRQELPTPLTQCRSLNTNNYVWATHTTLEVLLESTSRTEYWMYQIQ